MPKRFILILGLVFFGLAFFGLSRALMPPREARSSDSASSTVAPSPKRKGRSERIEAARARADRFRAVDRVEEAAPKAKSSASLSAEETESDRGAGASTELGAPALVDRPALPDDGGPLEVVTRRSLSLVLELSGGSAALRKQVTKELPYRKNNRRGRGRYAFQVQDRDGRELFTGGFDAPELCPLQGAGHDAPHTEGHVILEHETSVLLRVPRFPAGARLLVYRNIPKVDPEPSLLATLSLD